MKSLWVAIGLMLLGMCAGCRKQGPESAQVSPQSSNVTPAGQAEVDYDAIFGRVVALEDSLFSNPRNTAAMQALSVAAFDTVSGEFLVAGKGVANARLPRGGREAARKTAALRTAERWALYLKAWRTGRQISFGTPIGGQIAYSKLVRETVKDDTLLVLVLIPLGSVEVSSVK
jgi:hypothetical protein